MSIRQIDSALLALGSADDPRLGSRVGAVNWDAAIVGCCDDTGIANSGGRVGAALAPTEIRRWLYKQTTGIAGELATICLHDAGDVLPEGELGGTHTDVELTVGRLARAGAPVVFLGGGHDLAYASQSGVFDAVAGRGAILNLDTHLDVRPLKDGRTVTSGTPFRRVLERWPDRIASFTELGIQSQHNAAGHAAWLAERGGRIVSLGDLRREGVLACLVRELETAAGKADFVTVSLDMDVVAAAFAPGVSAPPADGLDPTSLVAFCVEAGRCAKVRLLDVVEVSPPYDENARTSRLAALCVWSFLVGVAQRPRG